MCKDSPLYFPARWEGGVAGLPALADPAQDVLVVLHQLDIRRRVQAGSEHVAQSGLSPLGPTTNN